MFFCTKTQGQDSKYKSLKGKVKTINSRHYKKITNPNQDTILDFETMVKLDKNRKEIFKDSDVFFDIVFRKTFLSLRYVFF